MKEEMKNIEAARNNDITEVADALDMLYICGTIIDMECLISLRMFLMRFKKAI